MYELNEVKTDLTLIILNHLQDTEIYSFTPKYCPNCSSNLKIGKTNKSLQQLDSDCSLSSDFVDNSKKYFLKSCLSRLNLKS